MWAVATAITALTEDTILVPTVILLGSFLVPICVVAFALGRAEATHLSPGVVLAAFVVAGTLAMPLTALTETMLLPSRYGTFVAVGAIEEAGKGLVLLALAGAVKTRGVRAGMVLGATVGAGFASFESAGYALSAVIGHSDDHPVLRIVSTELSRAALAPFGHITWTALLGGALFAGSRLLDRRVFVDVPGDRRPARGLGRELRVGGHPHEGPRRRRLERRMAQHRGVGRGADGPQARRVQHHLRATADDQQRHRPGLGGPSLAPRLTARAPARPRPARLGPR